MFGLIPRAMNWKTIIFKDFMRLPAGLHPTRYSYEVNALGEIRLFNPLGDRIRYKSVKPELIKDVKYLKVFIGQAHGVLVRTSLPIDKIVKKYF